MFVTGAMVNIFMETLRQITGALLKLARQALDCTKSLKILPCNSPKFSGTLKRLWSYYVPEAVR